MPSIYEIDSQISLIADHDELTDEDIELLTSLNMQREEKIQNLIAYIKNLKADAAALDQEAKSLAERYKQKKTKADKLTEYLQSVLNGEKFECIQGKVSYRRSSQIVINDEAALADWCYANSRFDICQTIKSYKFPKDVIKQSLNNGDAIPFVEQKENINMSIK